MPSTILERPVRKPPPDDPFYIGSRPILHRDHEGRVVHTEFIPLTEEDFLHPQEEDQFMHHGRHFAAWLYLCHALLYALRDRPGSKVVGERRIDWQFEGILPHGPDAAVFDNFPSGPDEAATLRVRDAGAKVVAVFEITSDETRHVDFGSKFDEYEEIGIPYYIVVDVAAPNGIPVVAGFRNVRGAFKEMRHDDKLGVHVSKLGLWFRWKNGRLIVADEDGDDIPDSQELASRFDSETARADALAAELAALKASLSGTLPKE
jgi:hypothetical protein